MRLALLLAIPALLACGGAPKQGPVDGPNIACDCATNPNCKTQDCGAALCPDETSDTFPLWTRLADEMCACQDAACADKVEDDRATHGAEMGPVPAGVTSDCLVAKLDPPSMRYLECQAKWPDPEPEIPEDEDPHEDPVEDPDS